MPKYCRDAKGNRWSSYPLPARVSTPSAAPTETPKTNAAEEPKKVTGGGADIPAPPSPWAYGKSSPAIGQAYQNALNAELSRLGYATIGVDGKLGGQVCGATETLTSEGVSVPIPSACYPSWGVKGADGRFRNYTDATLGKSYPHPAYVGAPKEEPKSPDEPKKVAEDPCQFIFGQASQLAREVQISMNTALVAHGYVPIPVTGIFDAATAGAIKLVGIANAQPPPSCEWKFMKTVNSAWPKDPPIPKKATKPKKKKGKGKKQPATGVDPCLFTFGAASKLATEVQVSMNAAMVNLGYLPIAVTGVFDAATAGVFKEFGGAPKGAVPPPSCPDWTKVWVDTKTWPANLPLPQHAAAKQPAGPKKCGHGLVLQHGKCVKPAPHCKKGQVIKKGHCVWPAVKCGTGFHVEGRECVKDIVVASIAKHGKKECPKGYVLKGKHCVKKAAKPPAAEASMFSSPVVWIGGAVVLTGLAWFMMRKKPGTSTALAKAA
jgi:hypothetical protein